MGGGGGPTNMWMQLVPESCRTNNNDLNRLR